MSTSDKPNSTSDNPNSTAKHVQDQLLGELEAIMSSLDEDKLDSDLQLDIPILNDIVSDAASDDPLTLANTFGEYLETGTENPLNQEPTSPLTDSTLAESLDDSEETHADNAQLTDAELPNWEAIFSSGPDNIIAIDAIDIDSLDFKDESFDWPLSAPTSDTDHQTSDQLSARPIDNAPSQPAATEVELSATSSDTDLADRDLQGMALENPIQESLDHDNPQQTHHQSVIDDATEPSPDYRQQDKDSNASGIDARERIAENISYMADFTLAASSYEDSTNGTNENSANDFHDDNADGFNLKDDAINSADGSSYKEQQDEMFPELPPFEQPNQPLTAAANDGGEAFDMDCLIQEIVDDIIPHMEHQLRARLSQLSPAIIAEFAAKHLS